MTLYAIIEKLKMLALKHPNVNSAYEGNIYDIMNANPQQKYASVVLTQQSHTQDDTYDHYGFNLFYVDRLVDDLDTNRVQIQSTGKSMLSNIIKAFCEEFDAECDTINYQTFTERFADECAGVYCTIVIDMVKDIYCTEKYWDETWATPLITVRNQNKSVEFTANGTYTVTYDATNYSGLGKVEVEVNVPDLNGSYDEGYDEGYAEGKQESYEEGKQDGYTEGFDVGKNQGLEEGYADGKADGIEEGYSQGKTDGFNEGKAEGYTEGKEDGISEQKAKLEGITITENGTYTKEDGYNEIVVEVPDLNGSYDEGYDVGYSKGVEEGTANAGAIIAETAQVLNITENGVYVTKYSKDEDGDLPVTREGNLIRTVNVNVVPTINPIDYGIKFSNSTFTALPDVFELPQRIETNKLNVLFASANKLTDISCFEGMTEIYLDGTFLTGMSVLYQTFQYCKSLEDITPLRNIRLYVDDKNFTSIYKTAKFNFNYVFQDTVVTDFSPLAHIFDNVTSDYTFDVGSYAFASTALKRFELDWDWSKCTNYYQTLGANKEIEYIQELDATNVTSGYNALDVISLLSTNMANNLTYFGGYKNQKYSMNSNNFLAKCPNLTRESCLAIVNNLYDFTGNGETPTSSQGKLKVHANFLTALGDDINIALNKGWTVTA